MSLFPAYSKNVASINEKKDSQNHGDGSWLQNSSFNKNIAGKKDIAVNKTDDSLIKSDKLLKDYDIGDVTEVKFNNTDDSDEKYSTGSSSERMSKSRKKKKEKKKKKKYEKKSDDRSASHRDKTSDDVLTEVPGLFYTDKRREPGNLLVETLYRPAVPLYDRPKRKLASLYNKSGKENFKKYRYYACSHKLNKKFDTSEENPVEESTNTKEVGVNCEKELTEKTRQFNEKLELDPNNIDLWLEYVRFQDRICKHEEVLSSSKSNARKVTAEKKIAILEKAISINPLCEELLNEKFCLAEIVYPPGKLLNEAMELLNKDKTNVTICRTVIRCSQFNLARCTTPGVMKAFSDALERLHQTRMRHLSNKHSETTKRITKIMLVLLLECGLFMRQAGLWEQLLALLKQYLEMNVSNYVAEFHESYKFNVSINEEPTYNSEETILQSNLPLSAIWLRIERLREACHWLPLSNTDSSDDDKNIDPQRFVFIDDIRYLVQPILPSSLNLHLVVTCIYLMKIPVLPVKHVLFEILHLNEIPYGIDAVENVLPVFFPVGLVPVRTDEHFLKDISDLISGPQYVNDKLGKSEFLSFIGIIFESAGKQLCEPESVALYSWYLRFNRFLLFLSRLKKDITYDDAYKKKIKKFAKEKLKEPQFRNELQLYNEYALLERDFGNDEQCLNVLHTAIKFRRFTYEKATYVALYRNIAETLLRANPNENRLRVINILCSLVDCDIVETATEKFKHVNTETLSSLFSSVELLKEIELIDLMTPHWFVEWIACHAYFLLLTKSVWAASSMVQDVLDSVLPNISPFTIGKLICEGLYEILVSVLHFHCQQTNTSFHVLQDTLHSAHKVFPNNLYFLHTLSLIETSAGSAGSPWWKLLSSFTISNSVLPRLFLVFILRHRISIYIQEVCWSDTSGHNLMFSLLDRLINDDISKKCPLIWRLYLQFLSVSKRECNLKNAFYRAVEECPWIKAIYVDAIQLLPENIQEIQDLLIEKELRLHSVMDELEILRDGSV